MSFSFLLSSSLLAVDICIPAYYAPYSLSYFAETMGFNIVIWRDSLQGEKTVEFKLQSEPEKDEILQKFKTLNSNLTIIYDKKSNILFCAGKAKEEEFLKMLASNVSYEEPSNFLEEQNARRYRLRINVHNLIESEEEKRLYYDEERLLKSETQWKVPCKFSDYLIELMKEHNFHFCSIQRSGDSVSELPSLLDEIKKVDFGQEGEQRKANIIEHIKRAKNDKEASIELFFSQQRFSEKPTMEKLGLFLQSSRKIINRKTPEWLDKGDFWIAWYMAFDSVNFIQNLLQNDLFDKTAESKIYFLYMVPSLLLSRQDKAGINFLLRNMDKIQSVERKRDIINAFRNIDKSLLDDEVASILVSYAKDFDVEELHLDTSRWIGDDLPDDYDRWQTFKISETELFREEEIIIDEERYILRYHKYKEPFKISGIPLKKFEETDWSTPETAYISYLCARNYDWYKYSIICDIDKIPFDVYSLDKISIWKRWNMNSNAFRTIYFRVDASKQEKSLPIYSFFICKLVNDKIVTRSLKKLEDNTWRVFRLESHDMARFSKHILNVLRTDIK